MDGWMWGTSFSLSRTHLHDNITTTTKLNRRLRNIFLKISIKKNTACIPLVLDPSFSFQARLPLSSNESSYSAATACNSSGDDGAVPAGRTGPTARLCSTLTAPCSAAQTRPAPSTLTASAGRCPPAATTRRPATSACPRRPPPPTRVALPCTPRGAGAEAGAGPRAAWLARTCPLSAPGCR